jgi:hypothetical protein
LNGIGRASIRVAVVLAAAVGPALAAASAGGAATPRIGAPFVLASGFQQDYGAGPTALGPDGTVWLAQPGFGASPSSGFDIVARAAGGGVLRPVVTSDGAGSATDRPVIAATATGATFVWQTASNAGGAAGIAQVRARSCTLRGCGPVQVLERWSWSSHGPPGGSGFSAVGDAEPGVVAVGGRVLAAFFRDGAAARMEWALADRDGRFGPVHALSGPGGPDPVLTVDGGVVAAWVSGDLAAFGNGVVWASWSARRGFSRPRSLASAAGFTFSDLVGAPAGGGVALAWLEGVNVSDPTPSEPIWVARRGRAGGFSRPVRAFGGNAFGLALAGASDTVALAFSATRGAGANSIDPGPVWAKRSIGGRPFAAAIDLDATAAAPAAVAVTGRGAVFAAWNACHGTSCGARIAVGAHGGPFTAPVAVGAESQTDAPALSAGGGRVLVTWQLGDAVQGAFVTP